MKKINPYINAEKQKTLDLIAAIETRVLTTPSEWLIGASGRFKYRIKLLTMPVFIAALKAIKKPSAKRGAGRTYPYFHDDMSTRDYIARYFQANHSSWDAWEKFFQPLNQSPCTLYENDQLDFEVLVEHDTPAHAAETDLEYAYA